VNRRTLIIIASVFAVLAVLSFIFVAVSSRQTAAVPMRDVLVAAKTIPARTRLTQAMFVVQQHPANEVDASALGSLQSIDGSVSSDEIDRGHAVMPGDIAPVSSLGLAIALRPGMRAVSIAVDPIKDVSDLLRPGDHVDVIAAPPRSGNQAAAFTIMRDITVLSVGPTFVSAPAPAPSGAAAPAAPVEARTVTLQVSPAQADLLTMADINTTLRLALRPPNEPASSGPIEHVVFYESTPPPAPVAAAPPAPATKPAAAAPAGVPVIEGDQLGGTSH
jgi:pilus assembly protein CpaB